MARAKPAHLGREKAVTPPKPHKARSATTKKSAKKAKPAKVEEVSKPMSSAIVALPEMLDASSATSIKEQLLANRGLPLIVDASQVRRTGMQAVQILLAAAQTWQSDGQSYTVANAADEFLDTLALVGLSREHLLIEGFHG
jgi:chemotaxis protein CheX